MSNVATINQTLPGAQPQKKLLERLAERYSVAPDVFKRTVSAVAMPQPHTEEELISCLIVANEHDLNPLTKEIHFMRSKTGQIQPIVGVDGWTKKLNTHPQFDGLQFDYEWQEAKGGRLLISVTCTIWRKDRARPTIVTEFMSECARLPAPGKSPNAWSMNPTRMLRHRALTQGARYAIGFGGVMDMEEFLRWQEMEGMKDITPAGQRPTKALEVPDDIPDDVQVVSEAEDTQDAPITNEAAYLDKLEEALAVAETQEEFEESWADHSAMVEAGRISREGQTKADNMHEKLAKKWAA